MRKIFPTVENDNIGMRVKAYVGTRIVFFGINVSELDGLLGFAIERFNPATQERKIMQGYKVFPTTGAGIPRGTPVDSDKHPFQAFQWSDYGAKPATRYVYTISAIGGKPRNLVVLDRVACDITTQSEQVGPGMAGKHMAVFNSGVAGSQAFSNRFPHVTNLRNTNDPEVWTWLSRGLREALMEFIREANDSTYSLYGAFYEFQNLEILDEFRDAAENRNVDVKLIVSWKDNPERDRKTGQLLPPQPRERNRQALQSIGVADPENCNWIILRTRTKSYLQHNKFLILYKDGSPYKVWTGSTNITDNGLFGQSNVGHVVNDPDLAEQFHKYWLLLEEDPERGGLHPTVENEYPLPDINNLPNGTYLIPSPRSSEDAIDLYAGLIGATQKATFFNQAFTIHKKFVDVLAQDLDAMRFVLLERFDSRFESDYERVDADYDVELAIGSRLPNGAYQRWVKEIANTLGTHVLYMHLKTILIDPASDEPILLTGSANYSKSSTLYNDENTLLIKGDIDIADIYLGELSRLFNHHYFRYLQNTIEDAGPENGAQSIANLAETDEWLDRYKLQWNLKFKKRFYFCP